MAKIHDILNRLPERCWVWVPGADRIGLVMLGGHGYIPYPGTQTLERVVALNDDIGVTIVQAAAMLAGSMYGFNSPTVEDILNQEVPSAEPQPASPKKDFFT